MTMPTLGTICDAVTVALSTAAGLKRALSYDDLKEGIPETPLLEVYQEEGEPDLQTYKSFRVERMVIYADLYSQPRGAGFGQENAKNAEMIDAILTLLRQQAPQGAGTVFGSVDVVKFTWSWKRAIFEPSQTKYVGARFTLTFWVKG